MTTLQCNLRQRTEREGMGCQTIRQQQRQQPQNSQQKHRQQKWILWNDTNAITTTTMTTSLEEDGNNKTITVVKDITNKPHPLMPSYIKPGTQESFLWCRSIPFTELGSSIRLEYNNTQNVNNSDNESESESESKYCCWSNKIMMMAIGEELSINYFIYSSYRFFITILLDDITEESSENIDEDNNHDTQRGFNRYNFNHNTIRGLISWTISILSIIYVFYSVRYCYRYSDSSGKSVNNDNSKEDTTIHNTTKKYIKKFKAFPSSFSYYIPPFTLSSTQKTIMIITIFIAIIQTINVILSPLTPPSLSSLSSSPATTTTMRMILFVQKVLEPYAIYCLVLRFLFCDYNYAIGKKGRRHRQQQQERDEDDYYIRRDNNDNNNDDGSIARSDDDSTNNNSEIHGKKHNDFSVICAMLGTIILSSSIIILFLSSSSSSSSSSFHKTRKWYCTLSSFALLLYGIIWFIIYPKQRNILAKNKMKMKESKTKMEYVKLKNDDINGDDIHTNDGELVVD